MDKKTKTKIEKELKKSWDRLSNGKDANRELFRLIFQIRILIGDIDTDPDKEMPNPENIMEEPENDYSNPREFSE